MKMRLPVIPFMVLLASVITGCGTTANYEKVLQSWVGQWEGSLVEAWGVPDGTYTSGDVKFLTYMKSRSGYVPGTSPTYSTQIIGNTAYTSSYGGSPGYSFTLTCKTTFKIMGGRVVGWSHEGNHCKA